MEERATLEHPDKKIKGTMPLSPTEAHPMKTAGKTEHWEMHKQTEESPEMEWQRKNLQSKGMEDSPVKELNEMEASKLVDIELKIMVIRMHKELTNN